MSVQMFSMAFIRQLKILSLIAALILISVPKAYSQQPDNEKYFLGSHWSYKPDTTVKRELEFVSTFAYELKFFNFKTLYQSPWNLNTLQNTPFPEANFEYLFGNPYKFYCSQSFIFGGQIAPIILLHQIPLRWQ